MPDALDPTSDAPAAPAPVRLPDWADVRAFVRRRVRHTAPSLGDDDVDEVTQEALVRLLRAVERTPIRNAEALMNEVARRTAIDHLRSRTRWSRLLSPWDGVGPPEDTLPVQAPVGDPIERLRFVVLEFFVANEAPCAELARQHFAGWRWDEIAERTQRSAAAVRKQWSRCMQVLRERFAAGPGDVGGLLPPREDA